VDIVKYHFQHHSFWEAVFEGANNETSNEIHGGFSFPISVDLAFIERQFCER